MKINSNKIMPTGNINTGRFRKHNRCCHIKDNQTIEDLHNSLHYPCGIKPENEIYLVKHYKKNINRNLENMPYLEKKPCIVQQRKGYKKKPIFIKRIISEPSEVAALAALNNF